MSKLLIFLGFFGAFSIVSAQCMGNGNDNKAGDFTVTDIGGNEHHLYSYLNDGKYVVLNFFRDTDSGGCAMSDTGHCGSNGMMNNGMMNNGMNNGSGCNGQNMNNNNDSCNGIHNPDSCDIWCNGQIVDTLNKVYKDYGNNTGNLIVLAINVGGTDASVSEYVQKYGVNYPVASGKEGAGDAVAKAYMGMMGHNHTLLIAPDKKIVEPMLHVHDMIETIKKYVTPFNGNTAIQTDKFKQPQNSGLRADISVESFTKQNIVLTVPYSSTYTIAVISANGQTCKTLSNLTLSRGSNTILWDGSSVAKGTYFLMIHSSTLKSIEKMVSF